MQFYFSIEGIVEENNQNTLQTFAIEEYPNNCTVLDFILNVVKISYYKAILDNKIINFNEQIKDITTSLHNPLVFHKSSNKLFPFAVKDEQTQMVKIEVPDNTTFEFPLRILKHHKIILGEVSDYYVRHLGTNYKYLDKIPENINTTTLALSVFRKE